MKKKMTLALLILVSSLHVITANAEGLRYDNVTTNSNASTIIYDVDTSTNSNADTNTPNTSLTVEVRLEENFAVVPLSVFDNYNGSISTTILSYFEGIIQKLSYGMKYVVYRSTDYDYYLAYSKDLTLTGSQITSPLVHLVHYYNRNGVTIETRSDSNFRFNVGDSIYYSNVTEDAPGIVGGWFQYEKDAVIFAFAFLLVFSLCKSVLGLCEFRW